MNQTTQLDVSMPNKPGSMLKVCRALQKSHINIEAIFCSEGTEYSTIHLIVNDISKAEPVLKKLGNVSETPVFTFEMKNRPGAILSIARMCSDAGINIRNVYATTDGDNAMVYVSVDDTERFKNLYQKSVEC